MFGLHVHRTLFAPPVGPAAGTIACVGVAPHAQGAGVGGAMVIGAPEILADRDTRTCHIGWMEREAFCTRVGYRPWRRDRRFRLWTVTA